MIAAALLALLACGVGAPSALAAEEEEGAVQYVTIGELGKVNPEDSAVMPPGEWRYINGLDVNWKTGDVYALDPNMSRVQVFNPNGELLFTFGEEGELGGQFGKYSSQGLTIDQETGDVYVGEAGGPFSNNRVSKFNEDGEFILTFGREVDATTEGNICTAASGDICQHGTAGSGGDGEIVQGAAPVVDQTTNNVLVPLAYSGPGKVQEFSPGGAFLQSYPVESIGEFIQAGPEYLYGRSTNGGGLLKWTLSGTPQGFFAPAFSPNGDSEGNRFVVNQIALAPGTDTPSETHLFSSMFDATHGYTAIGEWTLGGELVEEHAPGLGGGGQIYVAVDPSHEKIYATNGYPDGRLFVLGKPVTLPKATIEAPTNITSDSATLNGVVNPEGGSFDTGYHFEYRRDSDVKWTNAPAGPEGFPEDINVGKGTSGVPATTQISGLDPNTLYHVRLKATRKEGGGSTTSDETTFTTDPVPPVLDLIAAAHVSDTKATLQATIDPKHAQTTYHFEYGKTSSYGSSAPVSEEGEAGSQLGPYGVFDLLENLEPNTTYHFRLVATNSAGTETSGDYTFKTYTEADEEWPARDLELVNTPEKGDQNVHTWNINHNPVSPDGSEVLWSVFSGTPESYTGYNELFLAHRTSTGWQSQNIGVPASEQVGGGDNAYVTRAVSKDFSTYVVSAESGFFDPNHSHVFVKLTRNGEQEVLADTGNLELEDVQISDNGEYILYRDPRTEETVVRHNGATKPLPVPSCSYELESGGFYYPNVVTKDLSKVFVQAQGNEPACEAPGVYMLDRINNSVTEIAPGGYFVRTNEDGSKVLYQKEGELWEWTEGSGDECLTCGSMPPGINAGLVRVSEDLKHIYFGTGIAGGYGHFAVYAVEGTNVKFLAKGYTQFGFNNGDYEMETTPDGKTLLFMSLGNSTTADDTGLRFRGESVESNTAQLYRYSAEDGYVECVSCPGKYGPVGGGVWGAILNSNFAISADGSTIGFATEAPLVPEDINQGMDVYEWHNGVTRLVTRGEDEFKLGSLFSAPFFWGASRDGKTIVFSEGGVHLTGNEKDDFANVYASVVGGPWFPPEKAPAHCVEDSCQGPLQAPPVLETQGSEKFNGYGNPAPRHRHRSRHRKHHRPGHRRHRHGHRGTHRHG